MQQLDPAERLLELKICDPAMGSGHFLVNLVDHLADRVITALAEAEASVDDYISPLTERIDVIRNKIMANAEKRGWTIDAEQLDDRHIVRRMVLKRCIYGIDKNPMAVELEKAGEPLSRDFAEANERATAAVRMARAGGDYPLLSGGDINLYSLFVERAMNIVKPGGMVGLLTPSGIASDKTAARFFKGVSTEGRLRALYDFENRRTRYEARPFFPDVDSRFQFCAFVASPKPTEEPAKCAFFLQDVSELDDPERCFPLTAEAFARVNPNTGTAAIYRRMPVLVDRSSGGEVKAWPVKYTRMFDMTNDSGLFRTRVELEEKEGAYPIGGNRFASSSGDWVPLYVGRMIHLFDHRAASVEVNAENLHNAALSGDISAEQKADPAFVPTPQYWVPIREVSFPSGLDWTIAFRDIARATDARTMIAAAVPTVGLGNTAPAIFPEDVDNDQSNTTLLLANLGATVLDFVVRQKAQSTHLNWYIVEPLPVVPLRGRPLRPQDGRQDCPRGRSGVDLHCSRHGALRPRYGLCR